MPMKIHVGAIPDTGLRETVTYDPQGMDLDRDDIRVTEPFQAEFVITKGDREVVVAAEIHCPVTVTCSRCLTQFAASVDPRAVFSYKVHPSDVVDVTDDVRQEVLLAYPLTSLCREDCKGLCETCGADLNAAPCSHHAA